MNNLLFVKVVALLLLVTAVPAADVPGIELDHVWIMVSLNAPERAALERAGLQISREINHHPGTGTSSVTVEFENGYLELMWLDPSVPVSQGMERAAEKYRQRMLWKTSGWCPLGIGFRYTTPANDPLPFPTWTWTADWMPKGSVMEMLTPRDDTSSPALFIEPRSMANGAEQAGRAALYHHPIGVHRVTAIRLLSSKTYRPIEALTYLQDHRLITVEQSNEWSMELTFDGGKQKRSKDFRPDLPLVIQY